MFNAHDQNDWEGQSIVYMVGIIKNHQLIHFRQISQLASSLSSVPQQDFVFRTYVVIVYRFRELGDKLFQHCQVYLLTFNYHA